jgi:hypothetical protein
MNVKLVCQTTEDALDMSKCYILLGDTPCVAAGILNKILRWNVKAETPKPLHRDIHV